MAVAATDLLFWCEFPASAQDVPSVGNKHLLTLVAVSQKTLRLRVIQQGKQGPANEIGIVPRAWPNPLDTDPGGQVQWGAFRVHIAERPWQITIVDGEGKIRQRLAIEPATGGIHFNLGDGPIFGLGEGGHPLNRRGTVDPMRNGQLSPDLATYGARVPIPWIVGAESWGIFFAHPSGSFDLRGSEGIFQPQEQTPTRDIFIVLADSPPDLMHEWAELTGYPHMPPLWSLGYQQSHRTLESREAVLAEAKRFRDEKLPCDAMIFLGTGFCPSGWNLGHGSFEFNPQVFPDPAAMIQQLHGEHFKVVVHVTSPPEDLHGEVGDTGATLEDPSSAAVYWPRHRPVKDAGVDGWWPDEGDELNAASRLARNRMYWEGAQLFEPDVRPFALHRNGYAGLQRYGWLWSGDTLSTWATLAAQVSIGINAGLCGIPFWGTDTGGFVPTREFTAELFVRWFQFSAFCPSFRCHGRTWKLRLPWGWDLGSYEPSEFDGQFSTSTLPKPEDLHNTAVEEICRKYLNLRYQLLPYLYSAVAETHATGQPLIRSLWLAYPDDPRAVAIDNQYLWGGSILVAPVCTAGATHRTTYLPAGSWWDYWTNRRLEGGRDETREVSLDVLPLYVKAGTILPVGPVKQYTAQASAEPLLLRIYPGADGSTALYLDDGVSFAYQRGRYSRIQCTWNDRERKLSLETDGGGKMPMSQAMRAEIAGNAGSRPVTLQNNKAAITF
jgi:alpha-glucosidase (family GH31 glycosyl hydrolase)